MIRALKNLGSRAIEAVSQLGQEATEQPSYVEWKSRYYDPRPPEERALCEQFSNETELERLRRQCFEYFGIIERIEKERDGLWKMYRTSVSEHLNAQALLERHLMSTRRQLGRAVHMLNKMRSEREMEPIKKPADLEPYDGEPVGTAEEYADAMIKMCDDYSELLGRSRPSMVDGQRERDRVANPSS